MPLKIPKPNTPGTRDAALPSFEEITAKVPEESLLRPLKKFAGRNNRGKITTRHHGGGSKRMYRVIDFKRDKVGIPGKVVSVEYDPNRSARIALIHYADGEKRYIPGSHRPGGGSQDRVGPSCGDWPRQHPASPAYPRWHPDTQSGADTR